MGMPVTVEIVDDGASSHDIEDVFSYFEYIDDTFSTFKSSSEMMRINRGELERSQWSPDMKEIFDLAERTKNETDGYFDIKTPGGSFDPSGMVKGWAIGKAADILKKKGFKNFYVDAGGDIEVSGVN